jgi:hypothetical protein
MTVSADSQTQPGRYRTVKLSDRSGRLRPEPRILPRVSALFRESAYSRRSAPFRVPVTNAKSLSSANTQSRESDRGFALEAPLSPVEELNQNLSSTGSTISDFCESLSFAFRNQERGLIGDSYPVRLKRLIHPLFVAPLCCSEGGSFPLRNPSSYSLNCHGRTGKAAEKFALLTVNQMSNGREKAGSLRSQFKCLTPHAALRATFECNCLESLVNRIAKLTA